ncbi:MAG: tetratricopeptide repeat protein [Polyangiaceae bacterium]|nr:tetratricopeptide repeat protein [Polyangiaceae bacterium]
MGVALSGLAGSARADDAALADTLWQAGRDLFAQKDYAGACPKFEASLKLDRQLGTLLNLAECNGNLGRLATAQGQWREGIEWAKKNLAADPLDKKSTERLNYASDHLKELEPRVPKLLLVVRNPVSGVGVVRDGAVVDPELYGLPQPLDPATYKLAVVRGKQVLAEHTVTIVPGKSERLELDVGAIVAAAPPPEDPDQPGEPPSSAQRIAGIAVTATSGAAVLVAGGLELGAIVKKGQADRDDGCVNKFCSPQGLEAANAAKRFAEAGQWLGIAGLLGTAVGLTVWLTAPSSPEPASTGGVPFVLPWLGPEGGGLVVGGAM